MAAEWRGQKFTHIRFAIQARYPGRNVAERAQCDLVTGFRDAVPG